MDQRDQTVINYMMAALAEGNIYPNADGDFITIESYFNVNSISDAGDIFMYDISDIPYLAYRDFTLSDNWINKDIIKISRGMVQQEMVSIHPHLAGYDNINILSYEPIDGTSRTKIRYMMDCHYRHTIKVDNSFIETTLLIWSQWFKTFDGEKFDPKKSTIIGLNNNGAIIGSNLSTLTKINAFNIKTDEYWLDRYVDFINDYVDKSELGHIILVSEFKLSDEEYTKIRHAFGKTGKCKKSIYHKVYIEDISKNDKHVIFPWDCISEDTLSLDIFGNKE